MIKTAIQISLLTLVIFFTSCSESTKPMFELVEPSHSGVKFENTIEENDTFNVLTFEYIYNGGGVGVGDFNNDSLPDIFFAGNRVSSKCYLNKGDFEFQDITDESNLSTSTWCTGVAVHDFNQDGWLDIYVCTVNPILDKKSDNLLFINKGLNKEGIPFFEEVAAQAGVQAHAYSTQVSFLDYDLDGDQDMYLVTNSLEKYSKNNPIGQNDKGLGKSQDVLYRNDSRPEEIKFTDVSATAGIQTEGWGLGIAVSDINLDGYPDVYVANDFLSNDHLYINQHDGTFKNEVKKYFTHTEFNGMGVDVADVNNDGLNDVLSVDMLPEDNLRQKAMFSNTGYSKFKLNQKQKYLTQYVRNVLQINNGNNTFSDVGCLSGIYDTDWSWSALMADFDNDGWRDILITNGYKKDITDLDFVTYSSSQIMFGTTENKMKNMKAEVNKLAGVCKPNVIFKNNRDLTFSNTTFSWGLDQSSYSNGAAYADFDNDGDLDIVMNNINAPAFLYRNTLREKTPDSNFIDVTLKGAGANISGIGAKVYIYTDGALQYAEFTQQRGFKSTVGAKIHFGLGNKTKVDSLLVIWPLGKQQIIKHIKVNQTLLVQEQNALPGILKKQIEPKPLFANVAKDHGLAYVHHEDDFIDFKQSQALLLHKFSQAGPYLTTGDVDGNGLEDFVIGGSSGQAATIYLQVDDGKFKSKSLEIKAAEDEDVLLADVDGDKDLDLFCVSGSSEYGTESKEYQHRLYVNDGHGNFKIATGALSETINSSGSCIESCDYDKDGDLDLFVGGRVMPNRFPETPKSFLLNNMGSKGKPKFAPVENQELQFVGMVTGSCWVDFDNDTWMDLVVVGEWMPITFFKNVNGVLKKIVNDNIPKDVGWWRCIRSADFDRDGDMDFVVGNFGLNSIYKASSNEPLTLYAKDFDGNGSMDPIICRYIQGKPYPTHPRETMTEQIVSLRKILTTYSKFGVSSLNEILKPEQLEGATMLKCDQLASVYMENAGNGIFKFKPLPTVCQTAPVNDFIFDDVDNDGILDVVGIQNDYSFETLGGLYDAGIGFVLKGDRRGNFSPLKPTVTNFSVRGDAKSIAKIKTGDAQDLFVITQNQDSLLLFKRNR